MTFKYSALAAFCAAAIMPAMTAWANESLQLAPDPVQQCSDYAARASVGDVVPKWTVKVCDEAVVRTKGMGQELSAALVNRGALHLAFEQYDAALADSDAAIRAKADVAQAYINRGIALSAQKRNGEAGQAFTDALALNPLHAEVVYFDRAIAREDAGDMKGAYLDYRQAAQLAPTWDTPKQQLARFTVGHAPTS
jgi:tetratricopeptide (TPR) repeat protein